MNKIDFRFQSTATAKSDVLVLTVYNGGTMNAQAPELQKFNDLIDHEVASDAKFTGKRGQTLSFAAPADSGYKKILLLGAGKAEGLKKEDFRMLGAPLYNALSNLGYAKADLVMQGTDGLEVSQANAAAQLAYGTMLKSYKFDKYKPAVQDGGEPISKIKVVSTESLEAAKKFLPLMETAEGTFLAADVANEPPNVMYPESLAERIREELKPLGVKVKILDEKKMAELGMGAILAVGQGSERPPRMVIMEYDGTGGKEEGTPLALVGKGVTFDTGGISLKPGDGMQDMKLDMGGAAAVIGTMRALAGREAKVKVVGIVGLAENMPDGKSYRPGDIIKNMAGKTVNILNTDAEGRLVLSDALAYVQKKYNPAQIIDLATLTGACMTALGNTFAGVFSNSDKLAEQIDKSGKKTGELTWRLPLHEDFAKSTAGVIADLNNTGKNRFGGASTAAEFLHAHIDEGRKWAHIDMAGTGIPGDGISKGWGVQLLERFVSKYFEGKKAPEAKPAPVPAPAPAI